MPQADNFLKETVYLTRPWKPWSLEDHHHMDLKGQACGLNQIYIDSTRKTVNI